MQGDNPLPGLAKTRVASLDDGFGAAGDLQLREDVGDVVGDGVRRDAL
jgi:hypothetical protein